MGLLSRTKASLLEVADNATANSQNWQLALEAPSSGSRRKQSVSVKGHARTSSASSSPLSPTTRNSDDSMSFASLSIAPHTAPTSRATSANSTPTPSLRSRTSDLPSRTSRGSISRATTMYNIPTTSDFNGKSIPAGPGAKLNSVTSAPAKGPPTKEKLRTDIKRAGFSGLAMNPVSPIVEGPAGGREKEDGDDAQDKPDLSAETVMSQPRVRPLQTGPRMKASEEWRDYRRATHDKRTSGGVWG